MNKKSENINRNTTYEQLTLEMFIEQAGYADNATCPEKSNFVETTLADNAEKTDKV